MKMIITADTKIAQVLKENAKALDAIISISPKFEKLRNPLLRKVMAGRTSLFAASKFGGCSIDDFYKKLEPLGFEIDKKVRVIETGKKQIPPFITGLTKDKVLELDVRPIIASGSDPLHIILEKIKIVEPGHVLKIINSFEPTPLISLLNKKGFETYVDEIAKDHFETYFYKPLKNLKINADILPNTNDWEQAVLKFGPNIRTIDVRQLEMPKPMHTILEALDKLTKDEALFVYHKRIPVFLLPEISEKGFEYRIKEISDAEVHLLIFWS
jgi:uncharacterized protein (DUF2249 family)